MKTDSTEEDTELEQVVDELDIEEMTDKFRRWLISNRDRFLVDFENLEVELEQDEKSFSSPFL